jgi:hypothetical protein
MACGVAIDTWRLPATGEIGGGVAGGVGGENAAPAHALCAYAYLC